MYKQEPKNLQLLLKPIKGVKPGDICYDTLLNEFFVAIESQLPELLRRDSSFWVVDNCDNLFKSVRIKNK
jgi:hypothetical protein